MATAVLAARRVFSTIDEAITHTRTADPDTDPAHRMQRIARRLLKVHGIDVTFGGVMPAGPALVVANHISYLDPLIVAAATPVVPIAKAEVGRWPLLGRALANLGVLWVDRDSVHSGAKVLRQALVALCRQKKVLCFPEGTTSLLPELRPFFRGTFGIARLARVPVVPVRLDYADPTMAWLGDEAFLPHYVSVILRDRVAARLTIGAPLDPLRFDSAEAVAATARERIVDLASKEVCRSPRPL